VFRGRDEDIVEVRIEAEMIDATIHRTVRLLRSGIEFMASEPTPIQRANR
jgi:hypothetical protein